jgi:hypothetical protein
MEGWGAGVASWSQVCTPGGIIRPDYDLGDCAWGMYCDGGGSPDQLNLHGAPLNVSWGFADSMLNTTGLGKPVS